MTRNVTGEQDLCGRREYPDRLCSPAPGMIQDPTPLTSNVAHHQPNRVLRDIPRRQTQAGRPTLQALFHRRGSEAHLIAVAYRQYEYRLREIADHLAFMR